MPSTSRQVVSERLYLDGVLTQAMSLELGGELLIALRGCGELTLNLEEVASLDVSCLILLCAIKRQANNKGKIFLLEGLDNPAVDVVARNYRSKGNRLCRTYCGNTCLFENEDNFVTS